MTEKELNSVRELNKKIRDLERRLHELKISAENLVPIIDGLPHSSEVKSRVEKLALMIVEHERDLEKFRDQIISKTIKTSLPRPAQIQTCTALH